MMAALLFLALLLGQRFDAASVKRSSPGTSSGSTFEFQTGGSLRIRNSSLRGLIESAYDVRDFQIIGGPGWTSSERYDILARTPSGAQTLSRDEEMRTTRSRLQALLAE